MKRLIFTGLILSVTAAMAIADDAPVLTPGAYGSPATAKPLPADPYANDRGLTVDQLANPPGRFDGNPPLPSSVPSPVLPTSLNNMPNAPPFVSPAFESRTTPPLGIFNSPAQR